MNTVFTPVFPLSTFVLSCVALLFLFFAAVEFIAYKNDSNRRFIFLVFMFLQHNILCSIMPNYDYSWPILFQNIIVYSSSMVLAISYFWYLHKEFDFTFGGLFTIRFLVISLVVTFIVCYIGTYILTGDPNTARQVYIGFPSLVGLFYCYRTVRSLLDHDYLKSKIDHFKVLVILGSWGIIFMATMPLVVIFGDHHKGWNHLFVNLSLMLSALAYFKQYIHRARQSVLVRPNGDTVYQLSDLKNILTNREFELAYLLARKELTHTDIGKMMYISRGTVSKHASNMYKKIGVKNRSEFIANYLPD